MIIEIREEARGDLHTGYRFYEEQAAGLGRYFLECLFADIDSLRQFYRQLIAKADVLYAEHLGTIQKTTRKRGGN